MLVERFLCWMTTADARQRAHAAGLLVRLHGDPRLGELDRDAVEAGLTVLLDDPETEVRQALAQAVVQDPRVPHHLALTLAHDVPEVAAIIIAGTTQLLDGEMVDLVAVSGAEVQRAAAARLTVSPALSAALAEVGDRDAIVELLLNTHSSLGEFSYLRILARVGTDAFVRHAMELREGLTIAVRQTLVRLAVAESHGVPVAALDGAGNAGAVARDVVEKETVELAKLASDDEVSALVTHLRRTAQLTPALILRAAVTGEMRLAGEAIANLAGVPAERAFLVMERGEEAVFTALARKAGLPDRTIPALSAATEVAREVAAEPQCEASYAHVRRTVERVVDRYRDCRDDEMDDLIAAMRRYAGEAARDAARRYFERTVASQPTQAAIDVAAFAEPLLLAAEDAAYDATEAEPYPDFSGLGAAFDVEAWEETYAPEPTMEDAVAAAIEDLDRANVDADASDEARTVAEPDTLAIVADAPAEPAAPEVPTVASEAKVEDEIKAEVVAKPESAVIATADAPVAMAEEAAPVTGSEGVTDEAPAAPVAEEAPIVEAGVDAPADIAVAPVVAAETRPAGSDLARLADAA